MLFMDPLFDFQIFLLSLWFMFSSHYYHSLLCWLGNCGEGREKWYSQHWQEKVRRVSFSNLTLVSFFFSFSCSAIATRFDCILAYLDSLMFKKIGFQLLNDLITNILQVSSACWPDCWSVCLCYPEKNQIECRKGNFHIRGQCATANRLKHPFLFLGQDLWGKENGDCSVYNEGRPLAILS